MLEFHPYRSTYFVTDSRQIFYTILYTRYHSHTCHFDPFLALDKLISTPILDHDRTFIFDTKLRAPGCRSSWVFISTIASQNFLSNCHYFFHSSIFFVVNDVSGVFVKINKILSSKHFGKCSLFEAKCSNHWAILYYWRTCSASRGEAKNMADFHVCWRQNDL
jgi:hypothetical protein